MQTSKRRGRDSLACCLLRIPGCGNLSNSNALWPGVNETFTADLQIRAIPNATKPPQTLLAWGSGVGSAGVQPTRNTQADGAPKVPGPFDPLRAAGTVPSTPIRPLCPFDPFLRPLRPSS
jgi:hypothetical protein